MSEKQELKKELNFPILVILALTSVMGAGIFFLPVVAASSAGIYSIFSAILVALLSLYITGCFAELNSLFPTLGGVYDFVKKAYGKFVGFLIGWIEWIIGNITTAMFVVAAIQYIFPATQGYISLTIFSKEINISVFLIRFFISAIWIILFNYMAFKGIKSSAILLTFFGIIQLISITLFITLPFVKHEFHVENFSFNTNLSLFEILTIVLVGAFILSDTFFGMEAVFFLSEETKNAKKVVPKAAITSQIIVSILSIALLISSIGFFGIDLLSGKEYLKDPTEIKYFGNTIVNAPFSYLGFKFFGYNGFLVVSLLIYLSIIGSAADWIISAPRLLCAMARDKVFISQLSEIHKINKTPYKAIIFQSIFMLLFTLIGSLGKGYSTLVRVLMPLTFIMVAVTITTVTYFRYKEPKRERTFKVFAGKTIPIFIAILLIFMIFYWIKHEPSSLQLLFIDFSLILLGIPIYFLMQVYHDIKVIPLIQDLFAYITYFLEPINFPRRLRKEILGLIGNIKDKIVFEFGCDIKSLTTELVKKVGSNGFVIITDISKRKLEYIKRKLMKDFKIESFNVKLYHEPKQHIEFPKSVRYADVVVSVGAISYIQDIENFLKKLNNILPEYGKICFVDYADYFGFIPNVEWLEDNDRIKELFRKNGFSVRVLRKQGLFWNYVIIYGFKTKEDMIVI